MARHKMAIIVEDKPLAQGLQTVESMKKKWLIVIFFALAPVLTVLADLTRDCTLRVDRAGTEVIVYHVRSVSRSCSVFRPDFAAGR